MNNISVTVAGPVSPTRTAVATVVANSLTDKGFTNVALLDSIGEPVAIGNTDSILDIAIQVNPTLFATNICVAEADIDESSFEEEPADDHIQAADPALSAMAEAV